MGLNVSSLRIEYLTGFKERGLLVQKMVRHYKYAGDLKAPFSFSWFGVESPYDIFARVRQLYEEGNSRVSFVLDYDSLRAFSSEESPHFFTVIRDAVLAFPEFNFYFDETKWDDNWFHLCMQLSAALPRPTHNKCWKSAKEYLLGICERESCLANDAANVDFSLHSFSFFGAPDDLTKELWNPFNDIVFGKDNFFDASNLRYLFKRDKLNELHLNSNYEDVQESRAHNFALSVEEERGQNLFNCLSLFLNGFRALPVTSAKELERVNDENMSKGCFCPEKDDKCIIPYSGVRLILRDYDLQFPDAPENDEQDIEIVRALNLTKEKESWSHTYYVGNKYWSNLYRIPTFFVTKGFLDKSNNQRLFIRCPDSLSFLDALTSIDKKTCYNLKLPGLSKPVTGIYVSFQSISLVKKRYSDVRNKEKNKQVSTKRNIEGGHSVPLDLYSFVKSMVDRADKYYEEGRYIHSVIVANEAIEIINGFHQALSLRAYRRQALAENAVAANILGTSEHALAKDTEFRLKRIKEVITRLSSLGDYKRTKSKNTLNQIYNDIRIFCREKEHFEAESVVVRAIGHLNEGIF